MVHWMLLCAVLPLPFRCCLLLLLLLLLLMLQFCASWQRRRVDTLYHVVLNPAWPITACPAKSASNSTLGLLKAGAGRGLPWSCCASRGI